MTGTGEPYGTGERSAQSVSRRPGRVVAQVAGGALCGALMLAGMAFRPIEATAVGLVVVAVCAIVAVRRRRAGNRGAGAVAVAVGTGALVVLALWWISVLVHLEPDQVTDGGGTA
ncbi:hypothetical protein [Georgenia halophila]